MEYHKIRNSLDNTPNQLSKFRAKNWVEINDDARATHSTNSHIKFKTTMLKSSYRIHNCCWSKNNQRSKIQRLRRKTIMFFANCIIELKNKFYRL